MKGTKGPFKVLDGTYYLYTLVVECAFFSILIPVRYFWKFDLFFLKGTITNDCSFFPHFRAFSNCFWDLILTLGDGYYFKYSLHWRYCQQHFVVLLFLSASTWKRTQAGSFNIVVYGGMGSYPGTWSPNNCTNRAAGSAAILVWSQNSCGCHDGNNTEGGKWHCRLPREAGSKRNLIKSAKLGSLWNPILSIPPAQNRGNIKV